MDLTLVYRGPLRSSGTGKDQTRAKKEHKHELRKSFEPQLARRFPWMHASASNLVHRVDAKREKVIQFRAVITRQNRLTAELEITMLRVGEPGSIIMQGGDIDNRLKTLFDALRVPELDELPDDAVAALQRSDRGFMCLLEDDSLITDVTVRSDRLLDVDPQPAQHEALLLIKVRPKAISQIIWTS